MRTLRNIRLHSKIRNLGYSTTKILTFSNISNNIDTLNISRSISSELCLCKKVVKIALSRTKGFITLGFASLFSTLGSFDWKIEGDFMSITRIGLSNPKTIDVERGIYPNNSFSSLSAQLGITLDILNSDSPHKLLLGLRGIVGGVAFDNTRDGVNFFPSDSVVGGRTAQVGRYTAFYMPAWGEVVNSYLSYSYKNHFGIRVGRYNVARGDRLGTFDWFSGRTQGAEIFIGGDRWQIYSLYSFGRSSSNGPWLNHFTTRNRGLANSITPESETQVGRYKHGLFILGLDGDIKISQRQNLLFKLSTYYQPDIFLAPGFRLQHNWIFESVRFKTTWLMLFPRHDKKIQNRISSVDWGDAVFDSNGNYLGRTIGEGGMTLFVREDIYLPRNYNLGFAVYKNFGNANELISSYGDPTGINTWVYSLYQTNPVWSDFFTKDALNLYAFFGKKFQKWSYEFIGRYTTAPRIEEQSLALIMQYNFTKHIDVNLRVEWAGTTTKPGFKLVDTLVKQAVYNDKSLVYLIFRAKI